MEPKKNFGNEKSETSKLKLRSPESSLQTGNFKVEIFRLKLQTAKAEIFELET